MSRKPFERKKCEVCGEEGVPHAKSGEPLWGHRYTERHIIGEYRARNRVRRQELIAFLRRAIDSGAVGEGATELEERCRLYFLGDWPEPSDGGAP